ncbi:MAG: hypothetical protein ACQEXQ_08085 [Bacillota bacterium]
MTQTREERLFNEAKRLRRLVRVTWIKGSANLSGCGHQIRYLCERGLNYESCGQWIRYTP